jgi:hypothetical protein
MLYKNDIANLALGRLGVSLAVIDIATENSNQAKIIRRHFRMSLDTLLEKHPWNFANQYQALALQSEDLNAGPMRRYTYSLPADCLVLRQIAREGIFPQVNQYEDEKCRWQEIYTGSGPSIQTDVPDAHGKYTVRIPDSIAMPNHFGRALAAQLSMDIAPSLITNNFGKVRDTLNDKAMMDITFGIADDLGRQPQLEDSLSPFIRARL